METVEGDGEVREAPQAEAQLPGRLGVVFKGDETGPGHSVHKVRDSSDLYRALDELRGGDAVQVRVRRGAEGREVTLNMVLGEKVTRFGPT